MKVVDAGALVEVIVGRISPDRLGDEELSAPHLVDSEVIHVLRGLVSRGHLTATQGERAVDWFSRLTITRYAADWLRPRMWELRHNLSGYDATYIALAEMVDASSLLTTDAKLSRAPGIRCSIELL